MTTSSTLLPDFADFAGYFFRDPETFDEKGVKKYWNDEAAKAMAVLADRLQSASPFTHQAIEEVLRALAEEQKVSAGKLIHPARLALSGKVVGPGLFEMMELLGKETVVRRLRNAAALIRRA